MLEMRPREILFEGKLGAGPMKKVAFGIRKYILGQRDSIFAESLAHVNPVNPGSVPRESEGMCV